MKKLLFLLLAIVLVVSCKNSQRTAKFYSATCDTSSRAGAVRMNGRVSSVECTTFESDGQNRFGDWSVDGEVEKECLYFNENGKIIKYTEYKDGDMVYVREHTYDENENCIRCAERDSTGKVSISESMYEYDKKGNPLKRRKDEDYVCEYIYDDKGNHIRSVWRRDSYCMTTEYDKKGNQLKKTHDFGDGHMSDKYESEYDGKGNCIKWTLKIGSEIYCITKYEYDKKGNLLKMVNQFDDDDYVHEYTYDEFDQYGNYTKRIDKYTLVDAESGLTDDDETTYSVESRVIKYYE